MEILSSSFFIFKGTRMTKNKIFQSFSVNDKLMDIKINLYKYYKIKQLYNNKKSI